MFFYILAYISIFFICLLIDQNKYIKSLLMYIMSNNTINYCICYYILSLYVVIIISIVYGGYKLILLTLDFLKTYL